MDESDTARAVVQSFADSFGGRFTTGDSTSTVEVDWEYYVQTLAGQVYIASYAESFENADGEMVEHPNPGLSIRVVNYTDDEPAPAELMLVIEDDPNGFQRNVERESVTFDADDSELSMEVAPASDHQAGTKTVRLRYSNERDTISVIEEITAMG